MSEPDSKPDPVQPAGHQEEKPTNPAAPTEVPEAELDQASGGEISFNFSKPAVEYKQQ